MLGYHDNSLDGEAAVAVIKEVLEGRTEQVNDKNVVEAFLAEVIDVGNSSCMVLLVNVIKVLCQASMITVPVQPKQKR